MSSAYVVGERTLILGFKGAGFEIVHAEDGAQAAKALGKLALLPETSLVLITESVAADAEEAMQQFRENSNALLTTIPTHMGSAELGYKEMRKIVERAVGVDLLK
jgi:vacuolar-type H+-ATPase subunit F/Vma7